MKNNEGRNESAELQLESLDAVIAAPEHHKIVFENEHVRIVDFRVKPGETVSAHTHRWATINYVLTLSDFVSYDGNNNAKFDSRTQESGMAEDTVFCLPALPPPHSVKNIGEKEMRAISVELKN